MVCIFLFLLLRGILVSSAYEKRYDGYSVYHIKNFTQEQFLYLRNLGFLDFLGKDNVMVAPHDKDTFFGILMKQGIAWEILVPDMQITIDAEKWRQHVASLQKRGRSFSFAKYHRYDEMKAYVEQLAAKYPKVATVASIGKSSEGRDIPILKISSQGKGNRSVILVDAGIHAREWIAPVMALYIIQELVENSTNADLISSVDWHIIPLLNPDGYEYTHTNDRLWRKTRSVTQNCKGTKDNKNGVDLNRNFGFHWMEAGASSNPCSNDYAGRSAFSEPENVALRNYVKTTPNIKMYLNFHSSGTCFLYPWGYTSDLPSDWKKLHDLAKKANEAQELHGGKPYYIASINRVHRSGSGTSGDWMKGEGGVDFSYTISIPDRCRKCFDKPALVIPLITRTFWPAVRVFGEYVASK